MMPIYLAASGLTLSAASALQNAGIEDFVVAGISLTFLALLVICKRSCKNHHVFHNLSRMVVLSLTLIGFWMLSSVTCSSSTGRAAWASVTSLGSAMLLQLVLRAKVAMLVALGGFGSFQIIGGLVGIATLSSCESMSAIPLMAWCVTVVGLTLAAGSMHQLQNTLGPHGKKSNDPPQNGDTISLLNDAAAGLTQAILSAPNKLAASLQRVKQILNDAKISAKADIVLMGAMSTSSKPTDTTASIPEAMQSSRSLLDKETTRWLTTELQAASTRSFVRMGTKLRDGIRASQAHRTELLRTSSEQSNSATRLSTMDGSAQLLAQTSSRSSRPTPPGRTLTNTQIRQTLSKASLRHTVSIVTVMPPSGSAADLVTRQRPGSSGSTGYTSLLPAGPVKTMELGEMVEMVSDGGIDSSDDDSDLDSRHTFASNREQKVKAQERLRAARSFYCAPSNSKSTQLVRTFSQPGSMRKLLSAAPLTRTHSSETLLDFLPKSAETHDEYIQTRTLLNRKGSTFTGLPIPTNLQFVIAFSGMDAWKFNVFRAGAQCGARPLACVASVALEGMGLLQTLQVKRKVFSAFIMHLEHTYSHDVTLPNPYHNSFHAADVVQATHQFLLNPRVNGILTDFNATACLVAAAAHDYRHPGVNNTFLVKTSNPLAITYNDMAVLEHFHAAETFKVFEDPKMNILGGLNETARRSMRTSIIQCILATDLADGRKYIQQFASRADNIATDQLAADHVTLMQMCLKCADVCHAARPLAVHEKWSLLVTLEFHQQGDLERSLDVAISPLCDKHTFNMARSQLGFVDFVVRPCLAPFAEWCGNSEWTACLSANELHWLNMRAMEDVASSESKKAQLGKKASSTHSASPRAGTAAGSPHPASSTADTAAEAPFLTQDDAVVIKMSSI